MLRRIALITFLGYASIWTALLLVPDITLIFFMPSELPEELGQSWLPLDKIVHAVGYWLFTILAVTAVGWQSNRKPIRWVFAAAVLHGAATEIAQLFIPKREGSLLDWLADVAGVTIAVLLAVIVRRAASRRRSRYQFADLS